MLAKSVKSWPIFSTKTAQRRLAVPPSPTGSASWGRLPAVRARLGLPLGRPQTLGTPKASAPRSSRRQPGWESRRRSPTWERVHKRLLPRRLLDSHHQGKTDTFWVYLWRSKVLGFLKLQQLFQVSAATELEKENRHSTQTTQPNLCHPPPHYTPIKVESSTRTSTQNTSVSQRCLCNYPRLSEPHLDQASAEQH